MVGAPGPDVALDLVRDVEDRQGRQRRCDRLRDLDGGHRGCHLPGKPEVNVLARDGDLVVLVVALLGEPGDHGLHELLGRRGAGGEADDLVPVEHRLVDRVLVVDQRARRAPRACATSTSRCAFELVGEPITRISEAPIETISLTASCRFWVA